MQKSVRAGEYAQRRTGYRMGKNMEDIAAAIGRSEEVVDMLDLLLTELAIVPTSSVPPMKV